MRKDDFNNFLSAKLQERIAPMQSFISNDWETKYHDFILNQVVDPVTLFAKAMNVFVKTTQPISEMVNEQIGYSANLFDDIVGLGNMPWYKQINQERAVIRMMYSYSKGEKTISDVFELFDKDRSMKEYFGKIYQPDSKVKGFKTEISSIKVEFQNVESNLHALKSPKQKINWLVSLGFDKDEILSYDSTDYTPVLMTVDVNKIFGK